MIVCLEQGRHNLAGGTFQSLFCILLYRSSINSQRNAHALSLCKYTLAPQANCRSVCPSIHPPVCLFVSFYIHVCLSAYMSVRLYQRPSVYTPICLSTTVAVPLSVRPSVCLHTCLFICPSVLPSIHPCVCVSYMSVCLAAAAIQRGTPH